MDISPVRLDRDFRLLWSGQVISGMGNQITRLALPYQVYVLTHSTIAIAAITAVELVPVLVVTIFAGSLADAVDRRRLLIWIQLGLAVSSTALLLLALTPAPPLLAIFVVAGLASAVSSADQPTRASSLPRLVPSSRLPAAIALNQLSSQGASVIGPAIGGLLLTVFGVAGAYAADVATFAASLLALVAMSPIPALSNAVKPGLAAIVEGLRFARRRRIVFSTLVIDLNAMIFGTPTALFPVLALDVFKAGPEGVGLLAAAPAVGAFAAALLSGWVSSVAHVGRAVVASVVVWGVAITAFGLSTSSFALALAFLAIAGAADMLSAVFRSTIVQTETPDELRGRVLGIRGMAVTSGPRIGDIEAAGVASVIGPQLSVISGGLLCLVGVVGAVRWFPELSAYVRLAAGDAHVGE